MEGGIDVSATKNGMQITLSGDLYRDIALQLEKGGAMEQIKFYRALKSFIKELSAMASSEDSE